MHTNELDNGVAIIANGGDLSGDVIFVLPDGRRLETTWDRMFSLETEIAAMRLAITQHLEWGPKTGSDRDLLDADLKAALSPPTGKVLVNDRIIGEMFENVIPILRQCSRQALADYLDRELTPLRRDHAAALLGKGG